MFIDTHTHIYLDQFKEDLDDCMQRSLDSKVNKLFLPNIDTASWEQVKHCVHSYPEMCYPMLGLHPCSVDDNMESQLDALSKLLQDNSVVAIGEIGLDYYWSKEFINQQKSAFRIQIEWAKKYGLPIVIHSRDSLDDCIEEVRNANNTNLSGIFHCFNGSIEQAKDIIDLDFYIGLGGVITFKNAKMDDVVKNIPLDRIVLETDAPYLTPHPHRGKRNEPSYIPLVAEKIASVKGISIEDVGAITSKNALSIYQMT
jgi:TatD DNase family protein